MNDNNIKQCNYILKCIAPFCPEIKSVNGVWYPTEAICKRRFHSSLKWIKKQRRIARKSIYRDFYFSQDDLERIQRVTRKTMGRNPDKDNPRYPTQNHPEFNEKTLDKVGVSDTTTPLTGNSITGGQNPV
jgi:hypothetical protein